MPKCYLDRDGIFNHHLPYVGSEERFIWHYEIIDILLILKKYEYDFFLITNQSGIARGFYSEEDFLKLCQLIKSELYQYQINLEIRFCPHLPSDNCECRKPRIGMIENDYRSEKDIFIGDQDSDMICAYNANVKHRWLISPKVKSNFATRSALNHKHFLKDVEDWYFNDIHNSI